MPYTDAYLSALGMGFTVEDLKPMPYHSLLWYIHQHNAMRSSDEGGEIQGSSKMLASL